MGGKGRGLGEGWWWWWAVAAFITLRTGHGYTRLSVFPDTLIRSFFQPWVSWMSRSTCPSSSSLSVAEGLSQELATSVGFTQDGPVSARRNNAAGWSVEFLTAGRSAEAETLWLQCWEQTVPSKMRFISWRNWWRGCSSIKPVNFLDQLYLLALYHFKIMILSVTTFRGTIVFPASAGQGLLETIIWALS